MAGNAWKWQNSLWKQLEMAENDLNLLKIIGNYCK